MVDKLSIGTAQFGLDYGINNAVGKISYIEAKKILVESSKNGIISIDTAQAYGDSESVIGSILKEENLDFNVTTKIKFSSKHSLECKIQSSLHSLKCDQIDNLLFHSFKDYLDFDLKEKPKYVGKIGVSIYTNEELEEVIKDDKIEVIQLPFNLFDNNKQKGDLITLAKSRGKEIQARSVFLQGLFFLEESKLTGKLTHLKPELLKLKSLCLLKELPMETLALNYVLSQHEVDKVIIGIDDSSQLLNNIKNLDVLIDPEVMRTVDEIDIKRKDLLLPYNW